MMLSKYVCEGVEGGQGEGWGGGQHGRLEPTGEECQLQTMLYRTAQTRIKK